MDSAPTWRGGQNQVLLTARAMAERGHSVTIVCRAQGPLEKRARAAGLATRGLRFAGDLSPRAMFALRRLAIELDPDVIQLHDPHAVGAALLCGSTPRIATRRVDFPMANRLSRLKYQTCLRIVAVSRAIAGVLERDGVPAARVRVVHEGVPDRAPLPGGREILESLGIPRDAPVVGNVAALVDHKDHATLLRASVRLLAKVPAARVLVLGDGERRDALHALTRELGIADRVVFAGFRDDLDRLLPAFTVFCLSSRHEGLGTSLLDAMCFARPVVATRAGGIPEAVEDGVTGHLVPPSDPEALGAALVTVVRDASRQQRMGEAGRARFLERFTADRMAEATLDVYAELVAQPPPR